MARLHPTQLPREVRENPARRAEVKVYDMLADQLDDDWSVFYSVTWNAKVQPGRGRRDGEADFVLAHPRYGALVMEVKGGFVCYDGETGNWTSVSSSGHPNRIQDPIQECIWCRVGLRRRLRREMTGNGKPTFYGVVCFPDTSVRRAELPGNAVPEIVFDAYDMGRLEERLIGALRHWFAGTRPDAPSVEEVVAALERIHSPAFAAVRTIGVELEEDERTFRELNEDQAETLDELAENRRMLVRGCAGSGKTLLAVEVARRAAQEGRRVALTCYNEMLANDLAGRLASAKGVTVGNFHGLSLKLAREAGVYVPPLPEDEQCLAEFYAQCPKWARQAIEERPDLRFDSIVVDEGQDFEERWFDVVKAALRDPQESEITVFYDDNQVLYHERAEALDKLFGGFMKRNLRYNMRNTQAIHEASVGYYEGSFRPGTKGPQGVPVETIELARPEELEEALEERIGRLISEDEVKANQIVVQTFCGAKKTRLREIAELASLRFAELSPTSRAELGWATVRKFKGLECPVSIVVEPGEAGLSGKIGREMVYVAFTRAKSLLIVVGTKEGLQRIEGLRADKGNG